jgi:hypothetical protein
MRSDKIVHFVCFETVLDTPQFTTRWEEFSRSINSDVDVTIQQSENKGSYKYLAQHRCAASEFQFFFTKSVRSSRTPQVEIKAKQAGGYSILQEERKSDAHKDESKIFVFITNPQTDLTFYRHLSANSKLNIYEAYYENCQFAYILEYFVKNKYTAELFGVLKQHEIAELGIYKEIVQQTA